MSSVMWTVEHTLNKFLFIRNQKNKAMLYFKNCWQKNKIFFLKDAKTPSTSSPSSHFSCSLVLSFLLDLIGILFLTCNFTRGVLYTSSKYDIFAPHHPFFPKKNILSSKYSENFPFPPVFPPFTPKIHVFSLWGQMKSLNFT